ncbi:tat pathway signal sequence [Purpureocillium lavendulum]|uniref:Tat pathway signal sequence n=1 Tax=Purpureocillium lavendulum TaxID=1247861 RepID=A0AB34FXJ5_9HYPO|nr:tat pathway signal sequence [Purpureocillium lavendulum]
MGKESHLDHLLPDGSEHEDAGSEVDLELHEIRQNSARRKAACTATGLFKPLNFLLLLTAISIASFWAGTTMHGTYGNIAPPLRDVGVKYAVKQFNGSFLGENIYRKVGSPEVDKAWDDLGVNFAPGIISYEDGLKSGLKPHFVQRAKKYGGGFMVNLEGLHHLHCLNLVRKSLWFNYDHYKELKQHAFKNDGEILRLHVSRCNLSIV